MSTLFELEFGSNLATLKLALLIIAMVAMVAMVFALELKLSKTLRGLVYFVPYLYGGRSNTKYRSPLRAFDNFNSKAKNLDAFSFAKNENSKASRSPLTQNRILTKENTVNPCLGLPWFISINAGSEI